MLGRPCPWRANSATIVGVAVARVLAARSACAVRNSACVIATGAAEACRQPGGVADVVGMAVGGDDPRSAARPAQRRREVRSHSARVGASP